METRYFITAPKLKEIEKKHPNNVVAYFSIDGKKCYYYSKVIHDFLQAQTYELQNYETKQVEQVKIFPYLKSYAIGFDAGVAQFNNDFKVDTSVLYSNNADAYVRGLLDKWQHSDNAPFNGWEGQSEILVQVVTFVNMEKLGRVSGLRFALSELVQEHPLLFEKYEEEDVQANNPFIFSEDVLKSFSKFDGLIWDKLDVDWFRLKSPKKIKLLKTCTQPMFIYFFNKYLNKEYCTSPSEWLKLIFTPAFNYSNQNKENTKQATMIYNAKKKCAPFNKKLKEVDEFRTKVEELYTMK
jgi:hypothetical protein